MWEGNIQNGKGTYGYWEGNIQPIGKGTYEKLEMEHITFGKGTYKFGREHTKYLPIFLRIFLRP
jgi:hypothetical protein